MKNMTTPNKLTILRMILVPVFMAVALSGWRYWAMGIFIFAGATDSLDGYIARHYNQVTTFGKFMDPLADKLLVMSALLIFVQWGVMPAWVAMVVLARELAVTSLRTIAAANGVIIAAGWSGKIKNATTVVAVCVLLTPLAGRGLFGQVTVGGVFIGLILLTTIVSGAEYFLKNGKILVSGGV